MKALFGNMDPMLKYFLVGLFLLLTFEVIEKAVDGYNKRQDAIVVQQIQKKEGP